MAVYVDELIDTRTLPAGQHAPWPYHYACHMIADTHQELMDVALRLGCSFGWLQQQGTPQEHFDLAGGMRARAIHAGAVEVTREEMALLIRKKQQTGPGAP
jgi:hypothetical protein